MMANLFSTFDPCTSMNFSWNWISSLTIFIMLPPLFWLIPSRLNLLWISSMKMLHKELKILVNKNSISSTMFFISIFIFIMTNNFMGLFPYIFTSTSHLPISLTLSLPFWISFMLFGWMNNMTKMFAHLVPQNSPNSLLPFLVIIETISNIIRPSTLAIRLTANMIAGHLLVTLLSSAGPILSMLNINFLIIAQVLLLLLEFSVAVIQAYVFSILTTLYSSEVE